MSKSMRTDHVPQMRYGVITFVLVVVIGALFSCFTQVSQSHIGVVTTFGHIESDTLGEGPHLVSPVSRVHEVFIGLVTKLRGYGFLIQDINITNFKFSAAFDQAIEAKVTASQRAEQAERELARVKFEADQQIAKARGEAESIVIQAQAVKTNGGEEYLRRQCRRGDTDPPFSRFRRLPHFSQIPQICKSSQKLHRSATNLAHRSPGHSHALAYFPRAGDIAMSDVSNPSIALQRKRWINTMAAVAVCALIGACSNDDSTPATSSASSTESPAGSNGNAAAMPENPSQAAPAPAALTFQSPALPASGADAALSAAASAPLATPVIHTVD